MNHQTAVETPPATNGTGESSQVSEAIIEGQRLLIEELRREKNNLAIKIKEQEDNLETMRQVYWTLSRRLKYFANQFCEDDAHAGAIRFIVSESNHEWMNRRAEPDLYDPADSEIPF